MFRSLCSVPVFRWFHVPSRYSSVDTCILPNTGTMSWFTMTSTLSLFGFYHNNRPHTGDQKVPQGGEPPFLLTDQWHPTLPVRDWNNNNKPSTGVGNNKPSTGVGRTGYGFQGYVWSLCPWGLSKIRWHLSGGETQSAGGLRSKDDFHVRTFLDIVTGIPSEDRTSDVVLWFRCQTCVCDTSVHWMIDSVYPSGPH